MKEIFIVGNKPDNKWVASLSNTKYAVIPTFSLGEDGETKLCEYVLTNVPNDITACVIDVDSLPSIEIGLAFVMTLRLSLFDKHSVALVPVIFVTKSDPYMFYGYKYSSIILSGSIVFEVPENIHEALESARALSHKEYIDNFLNIIKVLPNAMEGRHSLANQWGADILSRMVCGSTTGNELIRKARLSLYFRYTLAQTLSSQQIKDIARGECLDNGMTKLPQIEAKGKKVLLLDDEANKGWGDVLRSILKDIELTTFCQKVSCYEDLPQEICQHIEGGKYDLIFLDLRMNGIQEENIISPESFSGMKILKSIKAINKGIQVIMFTASNKAWNMKALLDAGADGYYIKESPEYTFPNSYSLSNAQEFIKSIEQSLNNSYLQDIYAKVTNVEKLIGNSFLFGERNKEILTSIDIAYDLLAHSSNRGEYKAYAYLQLFLTIEEYVKSSSVSYLTNDGFYLYNGDVSYRILKGNTDKADKWYDSKISLQNGHYVLKEGRYKNRIIDTNFKVSAILIYKFGSENSSVKEWTKIYTTRNNAAHPENSPICIQDFDRILDFMLFFFDPDNIKWRDVSQAFPDVSMEDKLKELQNKFK